MADDPIDYLGRRAPLSLQNAAALPVGGPAGAPPGGAAPSTVPGGPGAGGPGGGPGVLLPGGGGVSSVPAEVLGFLSKGGTLANLASKVFGGSGPPGLSPGESAAQGGQGGVAAGVDASVNEGLGALGVGEAAAQGGFGGTAAGIDASVNEGLAPAFNLGGAASEVLGAFGPLVGAGFAAAADDDLSMWLGLGGAAVGGVVGGPAGAGIGSSIGSLLASGIEAAFPAHSEAWMSFPGRLGKTFSTIESSNQTLAQALANAGSREEIEAAIAAWKGTIGQNVGGFGEGAGPTDLPDLPGEFGQPHGIKQGIDVDFGPELAGLRAMTADALKGLPSSQRLTDFSTASRGVLSEKQAKNKARQDAEAEQQRLQDISNLYNVGSA